MSLRHRITLGFLIVLSLVGGMGLLFLSENRIVGQQAAQLAESSFRESGAAWEMSLALEHADEVARALLLDRARATEGEGEPPRVAEKEFMQAVETFERALGKARAANRRGIELAVAADAPDALEAERLEVQKWLDPVADEFARLRVHAGEFLRLLAIDLRAAERFLDDVFAPQLRERLLPLLEAYRADTRAEVAQEFDAIKREIRATDRLTIAASLAALALAVAMGVLVHRSISRPLGLLKDAAERIGRGDLNSRVQLESRDELGLLATSFNRMAEQLGETTLSVSHLDNVLDSMAGPLILIGPEHRIARVNRATLELLGFEHEELLREPFEAICPERARPILLRLAVEGYLRGVEETFVRKDGSELAVSLSGSTLRDAEGDVVGFVCVAHDLSRQKRVEDRIRASLKKKELLLREVHHRVKNNLQVVSSLLGLQADYVDDEEILQMFEESQNRVRSMALIHEQLYRSPDVSGIDLHVYLEKLTSHLFASYGIRRGQIALRLRLEEHPLDVDQAVAFGLIVNELVANSLKHAFSHGAPGEVRIELRAAGPGRLRMCVADNGRGLAKDFDLKGTASLGLSLVASLVRQLRGTLRLHSNGGTEFHIEFPAAPATEAPSARAEHAR